MKKKLLYIGMGVLAIIIILVGYRFVNYLRATARMPELSADLERRIAEWEKKEFKRTPLFGPAVPGNAAVFYQQAEEKVEDPLKSDMSLWKTIEYPSRPISPEVQAYYERNKSVIDIVRQGTHAETYKSLINLREGFNAKIPSLITCRWITYLMILQSREFYNNGQVSEAIKELCDIIRFGDDYLHYGSLLPGVIGIGTSETGREEIHYLITADKLDEPHLIELQAYLKSLIDSYPTMQDSLEGETIQFCAFLKDMAENSGFITCRDFWKKNPPDDFWSKVKVSFSHGWLNKTNWIDAWVNYIPFGEDVKRNCLLPYPQAKEENEKLKTKPRYSRLFSISPDSHISSTIAHLETMVIRKGLYILTALKLYKLRHGAYPETLSALAPEIIPELPLDLFSGQPFIYKPDKSGKVLLYSVRYDLKDDNGDVRNDLIITPGLCDSIRK